MTSALVSSTRGLLILFFRIYCVCFLLTYPVVKLSIKILYRPWLIEPIVSGVKLTLAPLKNLRHRISDERQFVGQESGQMLLLPAPTPRKRDINRASVEELRTIEGVGFVRALEIVEYRERFGDYRRMEELGLIRGVGAQTLRLLCETYEIKT